MPPREAAHRHSLRETFANPHHIFFLEQVVDASGKAHLCHLSGPTGLSVRQLFLFLTLKNDQGGISAHRRGCRGLIRWILLPSSGKGKVLLDKLKDENIYVFLYIAYKNFY